MGLKRNTHDFAPSSDLALKPLEGRVFEGERSYTNNERTRAIDKNYIISNSLLLFLPSLP